MDASDERIVAALYDGIVDEAKLAQAIEALALRFSCHSGSIVSFDPLRAASGGRPRRRRFRRGRPPALRRRIRRHTIRRRRRSPGARPAPSLRAIGCSRRHSAAKPFSCMNSCALSGSRRRSADVSAPDGRSLPDGASRQRRKSFNDDEIAAIERLLPHVDRGAAIAARLCARLEMKLRARASARGPAIRWLVVLDADGRSVHVNRAASHRGARRRLAVRPRRRAARTDRSRRAATDAHRAADRREQPAASCACRARRPAALSGAGRSAPSPRLRPAGEDPAPDPDPRSGRDRAADPAAIAAIFGMPPGARTGGGAAARRGRHRIRQAPPPELRHRPLHLKTAFARAGVGQSRLMHRAARVLPNSTNAGEAATRQKGPPRRAALRVSEGASGSRPLTPPPAEPAPRGFAWRPPSRAASFSRSSRMSASRLVATSRSWLIMRAGAGRDQPADDDVLLEAVERVDLAVDGGLGEHARGLLERRRRDERAGLQRRLGDAEQHRMRRSPASCPPPSPWR